jgi:outer membrane protein assembly factor BamB
MLLTARHPISILVMTLAGAALVLALFFQNDFLRLLGPKSKEDPATPVEEAKEQAYPSAQEISSNWPRFRGPGGLGIAKTADFPTAWNGAGPDPVNIRWKSRVPYPGHSSPVVWKGRVFLTGYEQEKHQGFVFCYDTDSGALLWQKKVEIQRTLNTELLEAFFDDSIGAAATMATDGRRAYAIFANGDLAAFDFEGNQVWAKHLGVPENTYGHVTSLAMYSERLLVQFDQFPEDENNPISKLIAFEGATGNTVFEVKRPVVDSWTSPIVIETGKGPQVITVASPWVIAYDPADGREIWKFAMEGPDIAPSPTYAGGLVFAMVPNYDVTAIRPDGSGDVTETHVAWMFDESVPDTCSPAANDELIFLLCNGFLTCCETKTGKKVWEKEFDADFQASPTIVGDKLYLLDNDGVMFIISAGRTFEEISRAELGEPSSCSPAFVSGRIYIRGNKHIFCIEDA